MRLLAFVIVLFAPSLAMAEAQQFDLLCSGATQISRAGNVSMNWTQRFSVDLAQGVFCQVPCTHAVHKLAAVEPYRLVLDDNSGDWPEIGDPPERVFFAVDRITGLVDRVDTGALGLTTYTGSCTPGPFTPLPKPTF